jgi:neutral ceramidase
MFDKPIVVMHLQGSAGDQSPAGNQSDFARMETIGNYAAPKIKNLWNATPTASGNIPLELLTRSIRQDRDEMRLRREGTADYYYAPYTNIYRGDDKVYDENGKVISPIDEFNTNEGAALCGGDESMVILGKLFGWTPATNAYPYNTCANVEPILKLMDLPLFNFDLGWATVPLETAQSTLISTLKFGPVPIYTAGQGQVTDNLVVGFFPGEPLSLYSDTFRKELKDLYGYQNTVTVGYSQDHEGYLLTLEDWLAGGYEPEINQWGPIQGEYILEQMVELAGQFGIDNPNVPATSIDHPDYEYFPLEPAVPDVTIDAGTVPARVPSYLFTYNGKMPAGVQPAAQIQRVTGVATFLWKGGDSAVDLPDVTIEREVSPGEWETVAHPSGRPWSNALGDIILTYTPDPLVDDGAQTHYWLASWQAVADQPSVDYTAGIPTGNYRFRVDGQALMQPGGSFPWPTSAYTLTSEPFQVVAQSGIVVTPTWANGQLSLTASYPAAADGFRLISMNAEDQKAINPLNRGGNASAIGSVTLFTDTGAQVWKNAAVTFTTNRGYSSATVSPGALPAGTYKVVVNDMFGNLGQGNLTVN